MKLEWKVNWGLLTYVCVCVLSMGRSKDKHV